MNQKVLKVRYVKWDVIKQETLSNIVDDICWADVCFFDVPLQQLWEYSLELY